ncbi:MAG: ATP-binding cassette domain-containing protein [Candidatus Riflebacteria bacterium]|nr:ATP-binding cassette domain-containing protein [Candidatus Riflebacteria bacterium]
MTTENFLEMVLTAPLSIIQKEYPVCKDFFLNLGILKIDWEVPLSQALDKASEDVITEFGLDREMILRDFCQFLETFGKEAKQNFNLKSMTIIGGRDKSGSAEISEWTVLSGEIISIVGPTGAGKSRLLADIECLADNDTPTGRRVHLNNAIPTEEERFNIEGRLVAQLSQNMNFVMDLTVKEFLEMHAGSRLTNDATRTINRCFECANKLAGEKFTLNTKVTQLSGGQSRALMIADTAYMSASPVVLIDEIENAGIDRRQAIKILAQKEKIVFISTHDPLLALSANKRIVIKNGGINKIIETSKEEKDCLAVIEKLDATLYRVKDSLRQGQKIKMELVNGRE